MMYSDVSYDVSNGINEPTKLTQMYTTISPERGIYIIGYASDLRGKHSQVGSLAGAAHLFNDNAGVLR